MKRAGKIALFAALLIATTPTTFAAQPTPSLAAPRAGICGSINLFEGATPKESKVIDCEIIGRVGSINEIYAKGFKVAHMGFLPGARKATPFTYTYLLIEERL